MKQPEIELDIEVNDKQAQFLDAVTSHHYKVGGMVGGRGSGKSVSMADLLKIASEELPRGKCGFGVKTISKAKSKLTPSIKKRFEDWGMVPYDFVTKKGDYVLWREPPPEFDKPFSAPDIWTNCISFPNGFVIELESFKLSSDENRGGDFDMYVVDEALNFKEKWLKIILPTLRGNLGKFESKLHHTMFFFSSPPWTPESQWMYDYEKYAKEEPEDYYFMQVITLDNQAFLPKDYIKSLQKSLPKYVFEVEVLGKRISKLPRTFYPSFSRDIHVVEDTELYNNFYNPNLDLVGSLDFNASFSCASVWQKTATLSKCVGTVHQKEVEKGDNIVESLGYAFCERYKNHVKKKIIITGDRNGKNKSSGNNKNLYDIFCRILRENGWIVDAQPINYNKAHKEKHIFINDILSESNKHKIRIDEQEAYLLIISIENSPMDYDFEKDKRSESDSNIEQERATHYSDTLDYYITWLILGSSNSSSNDFEIDLI